MSPTRCQRHGDEGGRLHVANQLVDADHAARKATGSIEIKGIAAKCAMPDPMPRRSWRRQTAMTTSARLAIALTVRSPTDGPTTTIEDPVSQLHEPGQPG